MISFRSWVLALFSPALSWKWCPNTFCPSHCSCILSSLRSDLSSPSEWSPLCLVFRCYSWSQNHGGTWEKWEPEIGNCSFSWTMEARRLGEGGLSKNCSDYSCFNYNHNGSWLAPRGMTFGKMIKWTKVGLPFFSSSWLYPPRGSWQALHIPNSPSPGNTVCHIPNPSPPGNTICVSNSPV